MNCPNCSGTEMESVGAFRAITAHICAGCGHSEQR